MFAFSVRVALFFQLATVYPLLLLIIRHQIFSVVYHNSYPGASPAPSLRGWREPAAPKPRAPAGFWKVLSLNVVLMAITTLVAVFYPKVLRSAAGMCQYGSSLLAPGCRCCRGRSSHAAATAAASPLSSRLLPCHRQRGALTTLRRPAQVGDVLRFTGAIGGFFLIFLLPVGVHLVKQRDTQTGSVMRYAQLRPVGRAACSLSLRLACRWFLCSTILHIGVVLVGATVLLLQFVPV